MPPGPVVPVPEQPYDGGLTIVPEPVSPPDADLRPPPSKDPVPEPPPVLPVFPDPTLPNLVINGNFERDLSSWTDLNKQVRVAAGVGVNHSKAAKIDPTSNPGGATWDALGQIFVVAPNTTYSVGGTASSSVGNGAVISFEVGYSDGTKTPVTIEIGTEFKVYRATIKTKGNPSWASMQIRHHGGGGIVIVDEVFLQPKN
ncbi:MAG: carbohydrate binding domain-containing protein [Deltaproteobacteria bacterium]|nr:carbohydrate binding domain-containing protein [Deltaproteobacteria bacterium]